MNAEAAPFPIRHEPRPWRTRVATSALPFHLTTTAFLLYHLLRVRLSMRVIGRVLHALLVLTLTFLLLWIVYYAVSLLLPQQRPPQRQSKEVEEFERVPTVQDIVSFSHTRRCGGVYIDMFDRPSL